MFERRLRLLLALFVAGWLVLVGRLGQLQLLQADHYREAARRSLILTPTPLPFVRGSILDRTGDVLVSDQPCWDLSIDYDVIEAAADPDGPAMARLVRRCKRDARYRSHARGGPEAGETNSVRHSLLAELNQMWTEIAEFRIATGLSARVSVDSVARDEIVDEAHTLRAPAYDIYEQVSAIRATVAKRRGFDAPVAEETVAHAIVGGLSADQQISARERFRRYPWVHVEPSSYRAFAADVEPFAHVLGRLGPVAASDVADDPDADDPFRRYRPNETVGVTGVEYAAEQVLRGRRGQIVNDREGRVVEDGYIQAENGTDVTLTIHGGLQRKMFELLREVVQECAESSGGSLVVLDVATREVLALVSYPSYDPNHWDKRYALLRDDTERLPLRFRAVSNQYAPGSIIKPLVCLAGLMNGRITLETREHCSGYLFDDVRDRWRCWQVHGTDLRKAHGSVGVVEALTGSCNVFMYRLGEALGVDALCSAFDMFGIGRSTGIGLREEATGINPTPGWLMTHKNMRATAGTARLFAIGQGEVSVTPVQAANLMATYASGTYRPVTLIRDRPPTPVWTLPGSPAQWHAIRRGIYGVVNDPGGTAYQFAHFVNDRFALCGKTGSATAYPWPTSYRVPFADETGVDHVAHVPAGSRGEAMERVRLEHPRATILSDGVAVATRWPDLPPQSGEHHAHAWFAGFLQPLDALGEPDWSRESPVAFAVLVEFGGSGGRTAGPLARRISAELFSVLGPYLAWNGRVHGSPGSGVQQSSSTAFSAFDDATAYRVDR